MFKRLHAQLTFFCTLITGLILVCLSLVCFFITKNSLIQNAEISFANNIQSIFSYLESQDIITHQWVLQMESSNQVRLYIYDGERPLLSQDFGSGDAQAQIKEKALEKARNSYGIDIFLPTTNRLAIHQEFSLKDKDGEYWDVSAAVLPKSGGQLGVLVLHSLAPQKQQLIRTGILFFLADLLALTLLGLFSWFFTLQMLHPIEESQKSQNIFIASASHELRSPLAVILSAASVLEKVPPGRIPHFASMIRKEGNRMSSLIQDMLTLANSDADALHITSRPEQLDSILLDTYEKYEVLTKSRNIRLTLDLPEEVLPDCLCDRERMEQVLTILMDNALQYVTDGGHILLGLSQKNNSLEIRIADNGPGIPKEEKNKIFERFYRSDTSRTDKNHYGLGLCIAREILRLHKGSIQVEDTPGGGATFLIQLPVNPKL
ncbi:MAG: sensor histidine kinase [Blautia sp.]|jgi:signal transduction histidine kinase